MLCYYAFFLFLFFEIFCPIYLKNYTGMVTFGVPTSISYH